MKNRKHKHHKGREGAKSRSVPKIDLFGYHAVSEAWLNEERKIRGLFITEQALPGFEATLEAAREKDIQRPDPTIIDKQALDSALGPGTVHQGMGIACAPLPEHSIQDFIISGKDAESSLLIMLDQVTDPHNVGAILRSACAFGVAGIIMQRKHAPEIHGALAKIACGAAEHVPVAYETNLSRTIDDLKEAGYFIYGLDERGEDINQAASPAQKSVIVLGAEGPGIRRLVKEHCDVLLRLPMHGAMPSINVSNAAAVALYAFSTSLKP